MLISDLGAHGISASVVNFYDTLGDEIVEYILDQTKLNTLVLEESKFNILEKIIKAKKCGNLSNLIFMRSKKQTVKNISEDFIDEEKINSLKNCGYNVYFFNDIIEAGKDQSIQLNPSNPKTIATLCYTSGTTGVPKAAMLQHSAIMAQVSSIFFFRCKYSRK